MLDDPTYLYKFTKIGSPKAFDITLNDGLKSLSLEEQYQFKIDNKKDLLSNNMQQFNPFAFSFFNIHAIIH